MAETLKLMLRQPGYFMWPLINAMIATAMAAVAVWLLWLEPLTVVMSEYAPPLINGQLADTQYIPVKRGESLIVTRYFHRHKRCPTLLILNIDCGESEQLWNFSPRGAPIRRIGKFPPINFDQTEFIRAIQVGQKCEIEIHAESKCTLSVHIDQMTPAKFKIVE